MQELVLQFFRAGGAWTVHDIARYLLPRVPERHVRRIVRKLVRRGHLARLPDKCFRPGQKKPLAQWRAT